MRRTVFLSLVLIGTMVLFLVLIMENKNPVLDDEGAISIANNHPKVKEWLASQKHGLEKEKHPVEMISNESVSSESQVYTEVEQTGEGLTLTYRGRGTDQLPYAMKVTMNEDGEVLSAEPQDKVLILLEEETSESKLEQEIPGEILATTESIPIITAEVPTDEITTISDKPIVKFVEKDIVVRTMVQSSDWGHERIHVPFAWKSGLLGDGIRIAILDSGIETGHEDLTIAGGVSFVEGTTYEDDNGHGTHVAGIIGAQDNNIGVVGVVPNSALYSVKVMGEDGTGYLSDIILGIDWAIQNDMDIINMSFGTSSYSEIMESVLNAAYDAGVVLVAASGNEGEDYPNQVGYPARYDSVIGVGAINEQNILARFSSYGPEVEVVAPGVDVYSTYLNNGYAKSSGTSMATPYVTGIVAQLLQANPNTDIPLIRQFLQRNVLDLGLVGKDVYYGFGLIQANRTRSLNGKNRYETAVVISQQGWKNVADTIVLGRGDMPIDALTGAVLAKRFNSPLLLTRPNQLPDMVREEITRLSPTRIFLLGGEAAISTDIEAELLAKGYLVTRIAGKNRVDTAVQIANSIENRKEIFLTTAADSPDPLSIATLAGIKQIPILITNSLTLSREVIQYINENATEKVTIIGGNAALSSTIEGQLRDLGVSNITRLSGKDRFQTAIEIVDNFQDDFDFRQMYFASGNSYVDALSGAPLAAMGNHPILLTHREYVPEFVRNWLKENNVTVEMTPILLGGFAVIRMDVRVSIQR